MDGPHYLGSINVACWYLGLCPFVAYAPKPCVDITRLDHPHHLGSIYSLLIARLVCLWSIYSTETLCWYSQRVDTHHSGSIYSLLIASLCPCRGWPPSFGIGKFSLLINVWHLEHWNPVLIWPGWIVPIIWDRYMACWKARLVSLCGI